MKNNTEFSNQFDILYNNIMSNQAPGLTLYEKSVFLTKAQDEVLKNYVNPKGNKYQEGMDMNPKRQIDLSMLTKVAEYSALSNTQLSIDGRPEYVKFYSFPDDVFIIMNERITESKTGERLIYTVLPISYAEYDRLLNKPYKLPLKNQIWRFITPVVPDSSMTATEQSTTGNSTVGSTQTGNTSTNTPATSRIVETVGHYHTGYTASYTIRYIRKPKPIILTDLSRLYSGVTIEGKTAESFCELDPEIHEEIIQRAVELAKSAYTGNIESLTAMGQRSE